MLNALKPLSLVLLLASAGAAYAQEADSEAETATDDAATSETTDPADDFSFGVPANGTEYADLEIGQPYFKEEFTDWALRCVKSEAESDPCQLYQLLRDADGNAVAEISMFPLPDGSRAAAGATIVVPLETLLTQQLTLTVDGTNARRYPFTFCNLAGCVARIGFTDDEVAQFKRGASATLRMVPAAAPDEEVLLNISLSGFTDGFDGAE